MTKKEDRQQYHNSIERAMLHSLPFRAGILIMESQASLAGR